MSMNKSDLLGEGSSSICRKARLKTIPTNCWVHLPQALGPPSKSASGTDEAFRESSAGIVGTKQFSSVCLSNLPL